MLLTTLECGMEYDGEVNYPGGTLLVRQHEEPPELAERALGAGRAAPSLWDEVAAAQHNTIAGIEKLTPTLAEELAFDPLALKLQFTATELELLLSGPEGRKRYFAHNINGLPDQIQRVTRRLPGERAPAWIVGLITHKAIGAWDNLEHEKRLASMLRTWAKEEGLIDEVLINDALRRSMDLLNQFKASDLFRDMAAAQSLRNEVPFAFSLDDRVVHGVADALYQSEKGQWVVVNFKTDRIEIEDVDKRTEEYLVQLGLYQAGMQMALGKPPQVIIYYLFPGVPIEIDGDRLLERRAEVHNLFNELNTQSVHLGAKLRPVHYVNEMWQGLL